MKAAAKPLLNKAINSLILSVEHFNRPSDVGRVETVLILLDHAFEMLLKAAIIDRGGRISNPGENKTIGFDKCVRIGVADGKLKFLSEDQALTLQTINGLRDAAQHHLLSVTEEHLYIVAKSGVTVFQDLLKYIFNRNLTDILPERVLPISTLYPIDMPLLFEREIANIMQLLQPGRRQQTEALARLRALAVTDNALQGLTEQPSERQLRKLSTAIRNGGEWQELFPGVAAITLTATGYGPFIELRITKKEGIPVYLVPEGTPGASTVAVKRVNELDFYSLSFTSIANKLQLTSAKCKALVWYLKLEEDSAYYTEIVIGKSVHKRYSHKALEKLREVINSIDIQAVWRTYYEEDLKPKRMAKSNG